VQQEPSSCEGVPPPYLHPLDMQAVIAEALKRELETYAQEEGIDMILNWGLSGEGVLYGGTPWDITEDVLDRLNERHPLMVPDTTATP